MDAEGAGGGGVRAKGFDWAVGSLGSCRGMHTSRECRLDGQARSRTQHGACAREHSPPASQHDYMKMAASPSARAPAPPPALAADVGARPAAAARLRVLRRLHPGHVVDQRAHQRVDQRRRQPAAGGERGARSTSAAARGGPGLRPAGPVTSAGARPPPPHMHTCGAHAHIVPRRSAAHASTSRKLMASGANVAM